MRTADLRVVHKIKVIKIKIDGDKTLTLTRTRALFCQLCDRPHSRDAVSDDLDGKGEMHLLCMSR